MPTVTNYEMITEIESEALPSVAPVEVGTPTDDAHAVTKKYFEDNSSGGGGSSIIWRLSEDANAPLEEIVDDLELLTFDDESNQAVACLLAIPTSYSAGGQIKLKNGLFAANSQVGDILFNAKTYLIKAASTVLGTYPNFHQSTNTQVDMSGTGAANEITAIGDIDLTDGSGEVNSVAVAGGDKLLIIIKRDNTNETSSCTSDAKLLRECFEAKFDA